VDSLVNVLNLLAIRKECTFFWNIGYKEGIYFFGILVIRKECTFLEYWL